MPIAAPGPGLYRCPMLRRLMFICLLMLASVWAAPGAMAHGAHDHGQKAQAQSATHEQAAHAPVAATAQSSCMTCSRDDAHHHDSDCCSFGCHLLSLPTQATLSLRDTLQAAPPMAQGHAAQGRNPSGLERPPRA